MAEKLKYFVNGQFRESKTDKWYDLHNPSTGEITGQAPCCTNDEVLEAMESSSAYTSVPIEAPGASDSDDAPSILDRYADDDNELDFTDDRLVIEEAIRDFSPREREVIELRFVKGMTQIEIAKKLGISQVQVSRLLRRTLKKIQDKIDPDGVMIRS